MSSLLGTMVTIRLRDHFSFETTTLLDSLLWVYFGLKWLLFGDCTSEKCFIFNNESFDSARDLVVSDDHER